MRTKSVGSIVASLVLVATMVLPVGLAAAASIATEFPAGLSAGTVADSEMVGLPAHHSGPTKVTSTNWAGYADYDKTKGQITEVFGAWQIPKATCPKTAPGATLQVQWVGIDGFNSKTVEQAGTYDYCSAPGASPTYYTWWEFYPAQPVQTYKSASAGDVVQVYVLYNPYLSVGGIKGVYTITVYDATAGYGFTAIGNPSAGPDVSAECISEEPAMSNGQLYPLTDYGSTTFLTCDATIAGKFTGIGSYSVVYEINQKDAAAKTLQTTGALSTYDYSSDHFTITWGGYT